MKEYKSRWTIEYYVENPATNILCRKQIRLQRISERYRTKKEARLHVQRMIDTLNIKLSGGWNPFFEGEDSRMYEKLTTVAELYLSEKRRELRENTIRSYDSVVRNFVKWCDKHSPSIYASMVGQPIVVRYMDYIYSAKNVGTTTYNNNIKVGRAFFNWAKEKCYTRQNPFEHIKPKPKQKKKRTIIPVETRNRISEYLSKHNPNLLIICHLIYTALIRPNEIRQLKIEDVFLDSRYIVVPGEVAKNHKQRYSAISQTIIDLFKEMHLERYPKDYYLFGGSADCAPSPNCSGLRQYWKHWDKMHKDLKLPKEMQLYSFRDTGIFEMLKSGIDDLSVMQHADHSSLNITTIYANHADPNLTNLIYTKGPKF